MPSIFTATSGSSDMCPLKVFSAQESPDVVLNGNVLGKFLLSAETTSRGIQAFYEQ